MPDITAARAATIFQPAPVKKDATASHTALNSSVKVQYKTDFIKFSFDSSISQIFRKVQKNCNAIKSRSVKTFAAKKERAANERRFSRDYRKKIDFANLFAQIKH
jgi:superfamily I DNA and/or RNA helicase